MNKKELLEMKEQEYIQLYLQHLKDTNKYLEMQRQQDQSIAEERERVFASLEQISKLREEIIELRSANNEQ